MRGERRLRLHHVAGVLLLLVAVTILWVLVAYTALPRLWLHHERRVGPRTAMTAVTAQGIPADPINLHVSGDAAGLDCALRHRGWSRAEPVTVASAVGIAVSVAFGRLFDDAPVSPLFVRGRQQDVAYEILDGGSADRRHHVRFWHVASGDWLGAASYDRGVGFSLFTLQVTHHIAPDVDRERALVMQALIGAGARQVGDEDGRMGPAAWHRNGGGDRYRTDGRIAHLVLASGCPAG